MEEISTAREIELVVRGGKIINPDSVSQGAVGVNDGESVPFIPWLEEKRLAEL